MGSSKRKKLTAMGALVAGFKEGMGVAPVWLGMSIVLGLGAGVLDHTIAGWLADGTHGAQLKALADVLLALGGLGAVVFLLQMTRRNSATRGSWWPAVVGLPALLSGLLFRGLAASMQAAGADGYGKMLQAAFGHAFLMLLLLGVLFTPLLALVLLSSVERKRRGDAAPAPAGLARFFDVLVPVGLRELIVSVGYQLLIVPGIWFDISYAFTPQLAVLHPEENAFKTSTRIARGIRSTLFRLNVSVFLLKMALSLGVAALFGGEALKIYSAVLFMGTAQDLIQLPRMLVYIVPVLNVFVTGWWLLAALQFFRPRMERLLARRAQAGDGAEGSA